MRRHTLQCMNGEEGGLKYTFHLRSLKTILRIILCFMRGGGGAYTFHLRCLKTTLRIYALCTIIPWAGPLASRTVKLRTGTLKCNVQKYTDGEITRKECQNPGLQNPGLKIHFLPHKCSFLSAQLSSQSAQMSFAECGI